MFKIIRPHNDDGDTHLFDGVGFVTGIHVVFRLAFEGVSALLYLFLIHPLLWWALRLHFLAQEDEVLATYRIDDPSTQRLHARAAGACLALVAVGSGIWLFDIWHGGLVVAVAGFWAYAILTAIFFINRKDDPVAHCWD